MLQVHSADAVALSPPEAALKAGTLETASSEAELLLQDRGLSAEVAQHDSSNACDPSASKPGTAVSEESANSMALQHEATATSGSTLVATSSITPDSMVPSAKASATDLPLADQGPDSLLGDLSLEDIPYISMAADQPPTISPRETNHSSDVGNKWQSQGIPSDANVSEPSASATPASSSMTVSASTSFASKANDLALSSALLKTGTTPAVSAAEGSSLGIVASLKDTCRAQEAGLGVTSSDATAATFSTTRPDARPDEYGMEAVGVQEQQVASQLASLQSHPLPESVWRVGDEHCSEDGSTATVSKQGQCSTSKVMFVHV